MPGTEVQIVPGGRGDFIVKGGARVVWDKKKMGGGFPDERAVVEALQKIG